MAGDAPALQLKARAGNMPSAETREAGNMPAGRTGQRPVFQRFNLPDNCPMVRPADTKVNIW